MYVKLIHLYGGECICESNEGRYMCSRVWKEGKRTLAQPNYLKVTLGTDSNWIRQKDSGFSILWFLFLLCCCCCIHCLKKYSRFICLSVDRFNRICFCSSFSTRKKKNLEEEIWLRWRNFWPFPTIDTHIFRAELRSLYCYVSSDGKLHFSIASRKNSSNFFAFPHFHYRGV